METPSSSLVQSSRRRGVVFSALLLFSLSGIAIMDFSVEYGLWYWLAMTICMGAVSVAMAWHKTVDADISWGKHLRKQAFHWGTLVAIFLLVYFIQGESILAADTKGMIALLMLALTTVLAGVHFDWSMGLLGAVLVGVFIARILAEDFFWVVIVVAMAFAFIVPRINFRFRD